MSFKYKKRQSHYMNQSTFDRSKANVAGMPKIKPPRLQGKETATRDQQVIPDTRSRRPTIDGKVVDVQS